MEGRVAMNAMLPQKGRKPFQISSLYCFVWCSARPYSLFLHQLRTGISRPLNSDRDYQTSELTPLITEPLAYCLPRFHWSFSASALCPELTLKAFGLPRRWQTRTGNEASSAILIKIPF